MSEMNNTTNKKDYKQEETLLYISEFLTEFSGFFVDPPADKDDNSSNNTTYTDNNKPRKIRVTPQDLRAVAQFRKLQRELETSLEEEYLWEWYSPTGSSTSTTGSASTSTATSRSSRNKNTNNPHTARIQRLKHQLGTTATTTIRQLDILIQRVQVWCTKAAAQHLLLSHNHQQQRHPSISPRDQEPQEASCWSFVLSLPSISYTAPIFLPSATTTVNGTKTSSSGTGNANGTALSTTVAAAMDTSRNDTSDRTNSSDNTENNDNTKKKLSRFAEIWNEIYNHKHVEKNANPANTAVQEPPPTKPSVVPDPIASPNETSLPPAHPCGLAISPNAFTWQEYSRICHMISLLPHPERIHTTRYITEDYRQTTSMKWNWLPQQQQQNERHQEEEGENPVDATDLVALWVRAQYNARARRHLVQLFQITRVDPTTTTTASTTTTAPMFQATFRGNTKGTHRRVVLESKLLDQIAQWAVINQVMFTQPWILNEHERQSRKRVRVQAKVSPPISPLIANEIAHYQRQQQQLRDDEHSSNRLLTAEQRKSLWRVVQSHFLRLFCHKHRRALSSLFFSNQQEAQKAQKAGVVHVTDTALFLLRPTNLADIAQRLPPQDRRERTLARIDRRILLGTYEGAGDENYPLRVVQSLLTAFWSSCAAQQQQDDWSAVENEKEEPSRIEFLDLLQSARDSFDKESQLLCKSKEQHGVEHTAHSFLQPSKDQLTGEELESILKALPPPWLEKCTMCNVSIFKGDSEAMFYACASCRACTHKSCIPSGHQSPLAYEKLVKCFQPLTDIFRIRLPPDSRVPDFVSSTIVWKKKIITVHRTLTECGSLEKLGLNFHQTEDCQIELERLLSRTNTATEVQEASCPLILPHKGCLVYSVGKGKNDCCARAGLQQGDVITGVELLGFSDGFESKYAPSMVHQLKLIDQSHRRSLFCQPATRFRLVVERPSVNVVQEAETWLEKIRRYNSVFCKSSTGDFWLCSQCLGSPDAMPTSVDKPSRIREDAICCQAAIRRIARESYDEDFQQEYLFESVAHDIGNEKTVQSLKRLDDMMAWICYHQDGGIDPHTEKMTSPFFNAGRRLSWASKDLESKPLELFCRGIDLLVSSRLGGSGCAAVRQDILRSFLAGFSSWCLAYQPSSAFPFTSSGPTHYSACSRFASPKSFCQTCGVRPLDATTLKKSCSLCTDLFSQNESYVKKECMDSNCAAAYARCASLVGKTVLCLPDDPLYVAVANKLAMLKVPFEHNDRPVEFCIVSYLPIQGCSTDKIVNGVFHLAPIANLRQLQFLYSRCQFRKQSNVTGSSSVDVWQKDGVIELQGMAVLSFEEVERKLKETDVIYESITDAVAAKATCLCCDSSEWFSCSCSFVADTAASDSSKEWNALSMAIETLLQSREPVFLQMVNSFHPERVGINSDSDEAEQSNIYNSALIGTSTTKIPPSWKGTCRLGARPIIPASDSTYELLYTDILFPSDMIDHFREVLPLARPPRGGDIEEVINISFPSTSSLFRQNVSPIGARIGWGLEVVVWASENHVRVGRVLQTAKDSGLKSGDIIESINGKMISKSTTIPFLLRIFLNIDTGSNRGEHSLLDAVASVVEDGSSRFCGPLLLRVRRMFEESTHKCSPKHLHPKTNSLPLPVAINPIHQQVVGANSKHALVDHPSNDRNQEQASRLMLVPSFMLEPSVVGGALQKIRGAPRNRESGNCLSRRHLYLAGFPGTLLTVCETSVLLEAIDRGHPMFGIRLLCPRYSISVILQNLEQICRCNFGSVPFLGDAPWTRLVREDFERSKAESSSDNIRFIDEQMCSYRMPKEPFPIDRVMEAIFSYLEKNYAVDSLTGHVVIALRRVRVGESREPGLARVRGGGTGSQIMLRQMPRSDWVGALVCGTCLAAQEGRDEREEEFVGSVESIKDNDSVFVNAFYFKYVGVVDKPPLLEFASTDLFVATEQCQEFSIAKSAGLDLKVTTSSDGQPRVVVRRPVSVAEYLGVYNTNQRDSPFQIGFLPDGRRLFWFSSDPGALYMSGSGCIHGAETVQSNLSFLEHSQIEKRYLAGAGLHGLYDLDSNHCCIWGCKTQRPTAPSELLTFTSRANLMDHYRQFHNYAREPDSGWMCDQRFCRIHHKQDILRLMAAITSAAAVFDSSALRLSSPVKEISQNDGSEAVNKSIVTSSLAIDLDIAAATSIKTFGCSSLKNATISNLFALGLNISSLFDHGGNPRVPQSEEAQGHVLLDPASDEAGHRASPECNVCNLGCEHAIPSSDKTDRQGLGCQTFLSSRLGSSHEEDSRLCHAKCLLLNSSYRVPLTKPNNAPDKGIDGAGTNPLGHSGAFSLAFLCGKESQDAWRGFVRTCHNYCGLLQAVVVLYSSIDRNKMPSWWRNEICGWSNIQTVLALNSIHALLLHLYVFDAAVCEYVSLLVYDRTTIPRAEVSPREFKDLSFEERVNKVLAYVQSKEHGLFGGLNGEFCCICQDGGELLCCELCSNVQHAACALPDGRHKAPDHFVCTPCMLDVAAMLRHSTDFDQ